MVGGLIAGYHCLSGDSNSKKEADRILGKLHFTLPSQRVAISCEQEISCCRSIETFFLPSQKLLDQILQRNNNWGASVHKTYILNALLACGKALKLKRPLEPPTEISTGDLQSWLKIQYTSGCTWVECTCSCTGADEMVIIRHVVIEEDMASSACFMKTAWLALIWMDITKFYGADYTLLLEH